MFTKNNIDYRNPLHKEEHLEEFTLKNIDTINLKFEEHIKTKSLILAPFNTSAGEEEFLNSKIEINNKLIKYNGKVRELNKNYELNNNGEIDNGMIISPNGNTFSSINNKSIDDIVVLSNSNKNKMLINKEKSGKNISNIMSLRGSGLNSPLPEEMLFIGKKISINNNLLNSNSNSNSNAGFIKEKDKYGNVYYLNERIISLVVGFGYSYNFIVKSLITNDLNYATASYYLFEKDE